MNPKTKDQPLVAIVDDDESVCEGVETLLKSIGFRTAAFTSGRAFLDCGKLPEVSCVVLDVAMPEMDGIELQRYLVANHPLPIIFITAHKDEKVEELVMRAGAIRILDKPFGEDALIDALNSALGA